MWRFDTEVCSTKDPTARPGEEKVEVAYLYEIQVTPDAQRHHIGSELMDILHLIAQRTQMRKVMLTVFAENKNARAFYDRHGYVLTSPTGSIHSLLTRLGCLTALPSILSHQVFLKNQETGMTLTSCTKLPHPPFRLPHKSRALTCTHGLVPHSGLNALSVPASVCMLTEKWE